MTLLIATVVVFGLAVAAMALGVLFGRAPIRGSCGGIGGGSGCGACSGRCSRGRDSSQQDDAALGDTC